jgi:hypothetical protein
MFEARAHRDSMSRQKGELSGAAGEALERREAMFGGKLADRVHPRMQVERRNLRTCGVDFGNARCDLHPYMRQRVGRHRSASC